MLARISAFVAIALCAPLNSALAQRVRGSVSDSTTREPVAGAVVTISDSAGRFLVRGIAGADGVFNLPRLTASKRVSVIRIGYRPIEAVVPDGDEPLNLEMRQIAAQLSAVTTVGQRLCPSDTGHTQAFQLWEQARTGLLASVVARDARPPTLTLSRFRRERDPVLHRVIANRVWTTSVVGDQPFVAARSASRFADEGYMIEHVGGEREYFAPDEAVLLDPAFSASHCLRVIGNDSDHLGTVGLAFEPVEAERDSLVEIRGTIWLDDKSLDLRSLEYEYTNVERVEGGSGGILVFQTTPTGAPMIVRWGIYSPVIASDESVVSSERVYRSLRPRPQRYQFRVLADLITGAEVLEVRWADGTTWSPPLAAVTGQVVDLAGRAVPNARVWMIGVRGTTLTDAAGTFSLPLPPNSGEHRVVAAESTLAIGGVSQTPPHVVVVPKQRASAGEIDAGVLTIHPEAEVLSAVCPRGTYDPGDGVVIVRVIDFLRTTVPFTRIDVEMSRHVAGDSLPRPVHRSGVTDPDGVFMICGAARDRPITVRVSKRTARGEATITTWTRDVMALPVMIRGNWRPPAGT
jgi:hypothetical protein